MIISEIKNMAINSTYLRQKNLIARGDISNFLDKYNSLSFGELFIDEADKCLYIGSSSAEITYKVPLEKIATCTLRNKPEYFSDI